MQVIFLLEKTKKIGLLFDYYGKLLTERQKNIVRLYYYNDLSLGEIAEKENVSRQAVFDHLKRSENLLLDYEEQLKFIKLFTKLKSDVESLIEYIENNKDIAYEEKICLFNKINDIKEYL